ncbi:MAG: hypothetical protein HRT35_32670 [Algicola sp.]|nr:hypothetical protein [Algicola sp.]
MNHLIKSSVALALLFSGCVSAEENLTVSPNQATVKEGVESLYTITAKNGKFIKGDRIRIFIKNDAEREFEIVNIAKALYEYKNVSKVANKTKNRLVINAANGVDKIRVIILFKDKAGKNTDAIETITLAHSYDDIPGDNIIYTVGDTTKKITKVDVEIKPTTLTIGERDKNGAVKPQKYTIEMSNGKKLAAEDTITIATSAGASKIDISLNEKEGTYDEKTSQITVIKPTDKLEVTVNPHKDVHNIKDMKFELSNIYKDKNIGKISLNLKGNSAGGPCTTKTLNDLKNMRKIDPVNNPNAFGACFNVHAGYMGHFSEDVTFKPQIYTMVLARSYVDIFDGVESFFKADLYEIPALQEIQSTTTSTTDPNTNQTTETQTKQTNDNDKNPFTQKNNIFRIATGMKFPIGDNYSVVAKIGARKVPSSSTSIHSVPVFYELGIEHSSIFGQTSDGHGRGVAGLAFSKDEFWQYEEDSMFKDRKDRVILYGSIAMNDARTILLHSYINANTSGNGPAIAGISISYGGNWESLLGYLGGDN